MRGLKIRQEWLLKILSREKTMEVRSMNFRVLAQRIALGNSDNGLIEGYATVKEIVKFPYSQISRYEDEHCATEWLRTHYRGKDFLYGFILKDVKRETSPFPYPKDSRGIWFSIFAEEK